MSRTLKKNFSDPNPVSSDLRLFLPSTIIMSLHNEDSGLRRIGSSLFLLT